MSPRLIGRRHACGLGFAVLAGGARAQGAWPDRPVRLINSGAPGSGIDLMARILAEALAQRLGQPFPVENRPGAGSVLAAQTHAQARPGESLLLGATGIASTVPYTFTGRLPYEAADLVPVAIPGSEFLCWAVPAALPVRSVAEFVTFAQASPGAANWYSVPGFVELDTRRFMRQRGLDTTYVAYQGSPPAVLDLVAGRIQLGVLPLTPAMGAIREGRLRALAVTSGVRAPALPEVPTMEEAGFADLRYDPFSALFGWRGMPEAERDRVAEVVAQVAARPATAERLRSAGIVPRYGAAGELAEVIASQRARVQEALRVVGPLAG
jgi:tripartite-type tricarboxylate transporter receptor subunit TctC